MITIVLRSYEKKRGKVLRTFYNASVLRDFVYHKLRQVVEEKGIVNEDGTFKDENTFIDIERNGKHLIYTFYDDVDWHSVDSAIYYIEKEFDL